MSNLSAAASDLAPEARRFGLVLPNCAAKPNRVARPVWLPSAVLGFACFMTVMAALAGVWAARGRAPGVAATMQVVTPPEFQASRWVEITRPLDTFVLAGGPYARLPMRLEARHENGGAARQDVLTYGMAQPGEAFVRLLFDRHEPRPAEDTMLFVDAARLAGTAGLAVLRSGLAAPRETRFGPFDVADVVIGRADHAAPCLAFRHAADVLTIVGLMCGAGGRAVESATLACSLDKIDLVVAGDTALRNLFNAAERQRGLGCSDARTVHGQADPLRPISSDLRGTLAVGQALGRELSRSR